MVLYKCFVTCIYGRCNVGEGSPVTSPRLHRYSGKRNFNYWFVKMSYCLHKWGVYCRGGVSPPAPLSLSICGQKNFSYWFCPFLIQPSSLRKRDRNAVEGENLAKCAPSVIFSRKCHLPRRWRQTFLSSAQAQKPCATRNNSAAPPHLSPSLFSQTKEFL